MFDFLHTFADGQKGNAVSQMLHPQQVQPAQPQNAMAIPMGTLVDQWNAHQSAVPAMPELPQQEMMQAPEIPKPPHGGLAGRVAKLFMGGM